MATLTFDTHAYIKKLKAVGFTEEQAEVQAETLAGLINDHLVTRQYFDLKLKELEMRLTLRLGGMMAASIAIVAALVKLL
ncbi:MAG TPA: DUF1640 domain-containing protein, partial [Deltaproteobacteria bacterium]|nr:DUF1640 domain-containing protein [Deltaproteobacteria bacterium]